jgi:hypothetical protein
MSRCSTGDEALSDAASGQNPRRAKRRGWGGAAFAPCCSGFRAHYRLPFLASGTTSFQMPIGAYSAATSLPECRALYRPLRPFLDLRAVSPYCSPARTAPLIASPRSRCHTNPPIEDGRARTSVEGAGSSTSARISAASGIRCFSGLFLRVPHRDPPANAMRLSCKRRRRLSASSACYTADSLCIRGDRL